MEILVPDQSLKYIVLQRLEAQSIGRNIHYSFLGKILYYFYERIPLLKSFYGYYSTVIETKIQKKKIVSRYSEIMNSEFETIRPYITEPTNIVLGIGPGIAGLEICLSNHSRNTLGNTPHLILLDKTGIDPIYYGYHEKAAAYNSLDISCKALVLNGHPQDKIEPVDASEAQRLLKDYKGQIDLVTSLIAWGFHFPLSTYLDLVFELLRPGGKLIVDVRKTTDGRAELHKRFGNVNCIHDDEKFERLMSVKH